MHFNYHILIEMEELHNYLVSVYFDIDYNYKNILIKYNFLLNKAHMDVLHNMIKDLELKQQTLMKNDQVYSLVDKMKLELMEMKRQEFYKKELENLPIFDSSTNTFITENIKRLMKENIDLLILKLENLEDKIDKHLDKHYVNIKKVILSYMVKRFLEHSKDDLIL